MLERLRKTWRPASFHYHGELERALAGKPPPRHGGHFEGWYFKLVDGEGRQPFAVIPGVFLGEDPHAFVQVLDGRAGTARYHRLPLETFRADAHRFAVEIGANRFSPDGIQLELDAGSEGPCTKVSGKLDFGAFHPWPVTRLSPGVMGPYGFIPFMECNHGILSLDHTVSGELNVDGVATAFDGGRGYCEKDWGRRFPSAYVWTQSNHFEREGVCITASVARIPWLMSEFRGFLIGLLLDGELHRFTTYTGAEIERLAVTPTHMELCVQNDRLRLEIDARKAEGAVLHAPYEKQMLERVAETMDSDIELRLTGRSDGRVLFEGRGDIACLEMQGDLDRILDEPAAP